jgi:hypothetical protein
VVEKNVEKGVRYNLLYYNDIDATKPEQKYYERNIDLSKTKYNSGIDSEFSKDIGFDIFIVKYHKSNKCEAYFAVNYSVGEKRCAVETFSDCNNPCDKSNEHLFYKRTNDDIASAIYERLRRVVATVGNDGEQ